MAGDNVDGFMDIEDEITIEDKDEKMEERSEKDKLEPVLIEVEDSRVPRALNAPVRPPAEEVEKHNMTHTPPRPWCAVCVEAYGKEDPHWRGEGVRMQKTSQGSQ